MRHQCSAVMVYLGGSRFFVARPLTENSAAAVRASEAEWKQRERARRTAVWRRMCSGVVCTRTTIRPRKVQGVSTPRNLPIYCGRSVLSRCDQSTRIRLEQADEHALVRAGAHRVQPSPGVPISATLPSFADHNPF